MKTLARAVLLAMMLMSHHAWAEDEVTFHHRPVKAIADSRIAVGGQGELPLYISSDWSVPLPAITRAVLVLHGRLRNADVYYRSAKAAQAAAGATGNTTIMIVPQFLAGIDVEAYHLPAATLRWTLEGWEGGEPAVGPAPASSFDALDAILARLADRRLFPNLKQVVVAGHSGGGQVVQRYAIAGRADEQLIRENIGVRYVVANPSSLPISAPSGRSRRSRHPVRDLTTGNTAWSPVRFIWPRPRRMNWSGVTSRGNWSIFSARSTPTPQSALDKSCMAEAQGAYRYARGHAYAAAMQRRDGGTPGHKVWDVPGVGHNGDRMLTSPCGMQALFDVPGCGANR